MNTDLGNRLKYLREQSKLSQEEVGNKLSLSRQCISSWEAGRTEPSIDQAIDLSKLYNVSIEVLITGKNEESNKPDIVATIQNMNENELEMAKRLIIYYQELRK